MKKILLAIALLVLTLTIQAQRIELDEVNPFNKRIIYTSWEKVNWKSNDHKMEVAMMLEGVEMSLLLNWQCKEMVGAERESEIVLLFDDMSEVVLHNKAFSVSGAGKISTSNVAPTAMGIQLDAKGDFRAILDKQLKNIRINTTSGEINFPVTKDEAMSLRKLYDVFEKQFYKDRDKK